MTDNTNSPAPESATNEPAEATVEVANDGQKFEAAVPASVSQSKGVLATAKTVRGETLRDAPGPNDRVTVGGVEMRLEQAEKLGFVTRDANGNFTDVSEDQLKDAQKAASPGEVVQEADLSEALSFSPEGADVVTNLFQSLPAVGQDPVAFIGEVIKDPTTMPKAIQDLAEHSGMDGNTAKALFYSAVNEINNSIVLYVMERGVSPEKVRDFYSYWSRVHSPSQRASAVAQAIFEGNARPIADVARQFIRSEGSGRATKAETSVEKVGTRKVETVTVNGITTSLENARRLGLV